jgi:hypothetical protein
LFLFFLFFLFLKACSSELLSLAKSIHDENKNIAKFSYSNEEEKQEKRHYSFKSRRVTYFLIVFNAFSLLSIMRIATSNLKMNSNSWDFCN